MDNVKLKAYMTLPAHIDLRPMTRQSKGHSKLFSIITESSLNTHRSMSDRKNRKELNMKKRMTLHILLIIAVLLVPGISQARYLNVNTGRFQTMDTYGGDNEDPFSLHKYLYGQDDSVDGSDPSRLLKNSFTV